MVQTLSSGTIFVSGAPANSGTLIASGSGSLLEIDSSAAVSGAAVTVGNGIVKVLSGGSANVAFLATGSGELEIEDSLNHVGAFTGTVSGFGGANHANNKQFIDLVSVSYDFGQIHFNYVSSSHTSGTLVVLSGGTAVVAQINMVGAYTSANFSAKPDSQGNVEIFDPTVPNGGSVQTFPSHGIDLPASPLVRRPRLPMR